MSTRIPEDRDTTAPSSQRWTVEELDRIGRGDELEVSTAREDGSLRPWVPIWVVHVDDELYVRSYRGAGGAWYRRATRDGHGRIRAGGLDRHVRFDTPPASVNAAVDGAYRTKYARYGDTYLQSMLSAQATATTLRLARLDDSNS